MMAFFGAVDFGLVWKLVWRLVWDWVEGVATRSGVRKTAAIRDRDAEARLEAGARLMLQVERVG
jgi:hypothetical protein